MGSLGMNHCQNQVMELTHLIGASCLCERELAIKMHLQGGRCYVIEYIFRN